MTDIVILSATRTAIGTFGGSMAKARLDAATLDEVVGLKVIRYDTMDGYKFYLDDGGFLLIRFSGTEPIVRVYTETTHPELVAAILDAGLEIAGLK